MLQHYELEETDSKIMFHVNHAVMEGFKNVYILSYFN